MWVWPYRVCPTSLLNEIFSRCHHIPLIWPRNCPSPSLTLSLSNQQPQTHINSSSYTSSYPNFRPSIWMNSKRLRMSWIMIISLSQNKWFRLTRLCANIIINMPIIILNITIAYIISLLGIFIYRSHLISSLLCLEGIVLSIFILTTLIALNSHFSLSFIIPIILLVFAACEAAVGLALLVIVSNTYGLDYVQNLNILQC